MYSGLRSCLLDEYNFFRCAVSAAFAGLCSNISNLIYRAMPADALKSLVRALLEHLPKESSPVVIVVKPDRPNPTPVRTNGHRPTSQGLQYDPSIVYLLELATIIALRDDETIVAVGEIVADTLQNIVRDAGNIHPLIVSRAVFYLLHLLNASQVHILAQTRLQAANTTQNHSFVRAPVILHTISSFDHSTLEKSAIPILRGLSLCIKKPSPLRNEITNTPDFWSTIQNVHDIPEAAASVFGLVENVVTTRPPAVTADNYEAAVSLLNSFAVAGSVGAIEEQKLDKIARKSKAARQTKPQ